MAHLFDNADGRTNGPATLPVHFSIASDDGMSHHEAEENAIGLSQQLQHLESRVVDCESLLRDLVIAMAQCPIWCQQVNESTSAASVAPSTLAMEEEPVEAMPAAPVKEEALDFGDCITSEPTQNGQRLDEASRLDEGRCGRSADAESLTTMVKLSVNGEESAGGTSSGQRFAPEPALGIGPARRMEETPAEECRAQVNDFATMPTQSVNGEGGARDTSSGQRFEPKPALGIGPAQKMEGTLVEDDRAPSNDIANVTNTRPIDIANVTNTRPMEVKQRIREDEELDEIIKKYADTLKKPTSKVAPYLLEAAARRVRSLDEDNACQWYIDMLKGKGQADRMWYEVTDWIDKDGVAAVTGYGSCESAGSAGHDKKCKAIEKRIKSLDPKHGADRNALEKIVGEVRKLMPWTADLRRAMVVLQDELLSGCG